MKVYDGPFLLFIIIHFLWKEGPYHLSFFGRLLIVNDSLVLLLNPW